MLRRSLRIALVVGTVLALINHGDQLLQGQATAGTGLKMLLTYAVPFTVATWSAILNGRLSREPGAPKP